MSKSDFRSGAVDSVAKLHSSAGVAAAPVDMSYYSEDVFNDRAMRKYLPDAVANKLLATVNDGAALDPAIAGDVAHAMKHWALDRGATHFTHWFLPLNGSTAEKHDSFLELEKGKAIMSFSGKNLIMSEPDASSFPSGGLRSTFEARGYTAWDPTSPAFIKRHSNGATLCIPTAFCSYTGETLDKKTPLLRSNQALSKAVKRLMKCFGLPDEHVDITLGAEQEYFLIDKHFYLHRPDLLQTGRTLFGAPPAKHQQLEDHYFGSIKSRVLSFMTEVEKELWKLGIPAKTRHNEGAPAQFELAPIFEKVNLAVDHNMLVMEVLRQVADRHSLVCLLHEKPFAGVNGSGKHNNWSVNYGDLKLLKPGNNPEQNAIFLTVLCGIIQAVDMHSDILRATVAGAGNDHRLGANEAPPAIISIYVGDQLNEVIEQLEKGTTGAGRKLGKMQIGVDTLPLLPRDATDRNRTSPFAFTGNKFEFRAPGSSQCCAGPMMILNTIVADSLDKIAAELEGFSGKDFNKKLQKLLQNIIKTHKRVIFNGDNYTANWRKEAAKRGLPNAESTLEALNAFRNPENIELFARHGVFTDKEMESRYEVFGEEYRRKICIEGQVGLEIVRSMIIPAVTAEYSSTLTALNGAVAANLSAGCSGLRQTAEKLGKGLDELNNKCNRLEQALNADGSDILPTLATLRDTVDAMELVVADSRWPLPKYREMLFVY
ncbi:MAG: glutamine synthetase type III [Lentisphaerae bacterium]|nr:glutamine synthetase type III [Lentisphaerota bacterium]